MTHRRADVGDGATADAAARAASVGADDVRGPVLLTELPRTGCTFAKNCMMQYTGDVSRARAYPVDVCWWCRIRVAAPPAPHRLTGLWNDRCNVQEPRISDDAARFDRRSLFRVGSGLLAGAAVGTLATQGAPAMAASSVLLAADEFDGVAGAAPNRSIWRFDTGGGGWGNHELEVYTDSRRNAALDGAGNLVITARREADGTFTSARLKTQGTYTTQYGRIEARIKIPRGRGIWPAFWMLGADIDTVGWPACGEIDIMENIGSEPITVHDTVHGPGYSGANGINVAYIEPSQRDFADTFNTYAVDWTPSRISWLVDGIIRGTVSRADVSSGPRVFDKPFFVVLSMAVGGDWPGVPDEGSQFPQQMLVDYVRVYQS